MGQPKFNIKLLLSSVLLLILFQYLKVKLFILLFAASTCLNITTAYSQEIKPLYGFDFFGDTIVLNVHPSINVEFTEQLSEESVKAFYTTINAAEYQPLIDSLIKYRNTYQLNDWLYYQLIRTTAQHLSPKADNYYRYTLYKWFLLCKSGYDATISIRNDQLLFYVQCNENIYDIPFHLKNGKQYVCLNYHDYGVIDFTKEEFVETNINVPEARKAFSYKVTRMPDFRPENYAAKDIQFNYSQKEYHFRILVNPQVQALFTNYPVVDYESYFNIPLSNQTYGSLIPILKKNTGKMGQKNGVDYLMRFTRHAFLFEKDSGIYGKEKRLSPEQTLLFEYSDCEDRAALFFYLVKEIYNLPMIALEYTTHVTIAVQFDKPVGTPIIFKGNSYSVCEPSPQRRDLRVGELLPALRKAPYEVVYEYNPYK